jgi:murein DD-endopeptidase MepM/ murein hydrolase activator NlpD
MARLTPEQRRNIRTVIRVGRRLDAPRKHIKAAVETIGVEANYGNPAGGSGSSVGAFQEIDIWGSAAKRRNVRGAASRFYSKAAKADRGQPSYVLAQDVQRSAFPGRYQEKAPEAGEILRHFEQRRGRGNRSAAAGRSGTTSPSPDTAVDHSQDRMALAAAYFQERGRPGALVRLAEGLEAAQDVPAQPAQGRPGEALPRSEGGRRKRSSGLVRGTGAVIGTPGSGTHTMGNWQSDRAIDVSVPRGTPVYTPASGRVVKVKRAPEGGRISGSSITVRKADGTNEYFFTHLSDVNVKPGQRVKKGQQIGRSGVAVGVPHLHFGQKRGDPRKRRR